VAAANTPGFPQIRALVEDTVEVAHLLLSKVDELQVAASRQDAASHRRLSTVLPDILSELKQRGRRGPRLHQPLRLLLTGKAEGAPVVDTFRILEFAETEGGDEVGVKLQDRLALVRELFPVPGHDSASEAGCVSANHGHNEVMAQGGGGGDAVEGGQDVAVEVREVPRSVDRFGEVEPIGRGRGEVLEIS